jgi:hypothetical protein
MDVINWTQAHWGIIVTILFFVSEWLGETQKAKSNSVYGLIVNFLIKFFKGEAKKAEPEIIKAIEKE